MTICHDYDQNNRRNSLKKHLFINPSSAGPVHIQDPHLVITVPADVLAPHGARTSAGTVIMAHLHIFLMKFLWLEVMPSYCFWQNDVIQNGRKDLKKSHGIHAVDMKKKLLSAVSLPFWSQDWWVNHIFYVFMIMRDLVGPAENSGEKHFCLVTNCLNWKNI